MANPAKYDPSASMVSPPDPELDTDPDPELTGTEYPMGVSVPVYWTPFSDPVPTSGVPITVPAPEVIGVVGYCDDFLLQNHITSCYNQITNFYNHKIVTNDVTYTTLPLRKSDLSTSLIIIP